MLLEKILFESGETLYLPPLVKDLPFKIKKSLPAQGGCLPITTGGLGKKLKHFMKRP